MWRLIWILIVFNCVEALAQDYRKRADELFEAGELAYNSGKYDEALQQFNQCLVADAGYYEAYTSRAATKERLKDWNGAVTDYSIYLEKYPHQSEALFSRGLARYQAAQYEAASEDFKKFLQLPSSGETQSIFYRQSTFGGGTDQIISAQGSIKDYVLNYIGLAEYKLKHYYIALAYFDSAIIINPKEADYYVHRGLTKQDQNNLDGAEADYQKALSLNENHSIAHHNLGILMSKKENPSAVEEQLNKAIELNPELSYPYLERAYFRLNQGYLKGALEDYDKAIALNNTDADSWINRGLVKEKLQDFTGAYKDFTRAIALKKNYEKAWFCRGNVLSKMNKLSESAEDYSVAILYYPEYTQAYVNRAIVRHRLGQLKEACSDIQIAESLHAEGIERIKTVVCK